MPFQIQPTNPKAMGLASVAGLAAWKASNFAVDPSHLIMVASAALTGLAAPKDSSSRPNVQAESHIVTPYVNNVESENK